MVAVSIDVEAADGVVVGLVPTGGTFTSFLADQAVSAGSDALTSHFTGNASRVAGEQNTVREVAFTDLEIALAVALAEADKLPEGAQTNEAGATYAWFQGGPSTRTPLPTRRSGTASSPGWAAAREERR